MDPPEETRELADVTIRAQETNSGFFVASYQPTSPDTHPARHGFSIDTKRGLRGKNLTEVLAFAEAFWRPELPGHVIPLRQVPSNHLGRRRRRL